MAKMSGKVPAVMKARRQQKKKKGSSTTGKSKGLVPAPEDRAMAQNSRSYKDPRYAGWCAWADRKNKSGGTGAAANITR